MMVARSFYRGWAIESEDGEYWTYTDTGEPVSPEHGGKERPCGKCGRDALGGIDVCLGLLPGVSNACCGHGARGESYVQFENGVTLRGFVMDEPAVVAGS